MSYATPQEAIDRYGLDYLLVSADRDNDGRLDETPIQLALDDASSEIDKYLSARYDVPLSEPLPASMVWVKRSCVDIAVYYLSATHDVLTEEKRRRFEDAIKQLIMIANGDLNTGGDTPGSEGGAAYVDAADRVMTRTALCEVL